VRGFNAAINAYGSMAGSTDDTNRNAVFKLSGTCSSVTFFGLTINGDGLLANRQRGIGYDYYSPPILTDINILSCDFHNLLIAVILPGVNQARFIDNTVNGTIGSDSGQGIGFVTEISGSTKPRSVLFSGNTFYRTTRHAIYTNYIEGGSLVGNQFQEHAPSFTGAATTGRAAIAIARCFGISISANTFLDCRDAALIVDQDSTTIVSAITVTGNTFYNTRGVSLKVGRTGSTGECYFVNVTGNTFVTNGAYNSADIVITDVKRLKFAENIIDANRAYPLTKTIIDISEYDAAYFEDIDISNNIGSISSSGSAHFVTMSVGISTSQYGPYMLKNNSITGVTRLYLYAPAGVCYNDKIRTDWDYEYTISSAGTPSVAGYNTFRVSLAAPGNITFFNNGYNQQVIRLYFDNANATLTNAMYLAGGANFTSSTSDYMQLLYRSGATNWFEQSRSVN
jgi:hypothetical protein